MNTGTISARVYTSNAEIPVQNAGVGITMRTDSGSRLLGYRYSDENGKTPPVTVEAPDAELSRLPGTELPFAAVDVIVAHPDYKTILIENVQIFSGVETVQPAQLIPVGEFPLLIDESEVFDISAQNL